MYCIGSGSHSLRSSISPVRIRYGLGYRRYTLDELLVPLDIYDEGVNHSSGMELANTGYTLPALMPRIWQLFPIMVTVNCNPKTPLPDVSHLVTAMCLASTGLFVDIVAVCGLLLPSFSIINYIFEIVHGEKVLKLLWISFRLVMKLGHCAGLARSSLWASPLQP
jgi:hypothetical protein